ncbi:hypothetical protein [Amycolatopsis sp. YIM 10]|uniref:hypothetical protein n=1 Tax=Amycolatopsis sp. YIM 10 TaxID=2653857 RepID=UPI00128FDCAF|nr:hypothetical protein [Amycolatopsis sp. YIM 10]QFU86740.1 hypothetical protein YIM_07645 [Amycolatopsis sp. YIM 10]
MFPNTAPAAPDTATANEPRSAAEHCAAAEALFARARAIHPTLNIRPVNQDEYRRCLDWASLHLRLAEAITAGTEMVLAHRQLLASDVRLHTTHVGSEASGWTEFLRDHHNTTGTRP